jgi:hypothetical protein
MEMMSHERKLDITIVPTGGSPIAKSGISQYAVQQFAICHLPAELYSSVPDRSLTYVSIVSYC